MEYNINNLFFNRINEYSSDINEVLKNKEKNNEFIENARNILSSVITLSVIIMTFNEERCIERCIESIENIADEIIIIDTGSLDKTTEIIKTKFPKVKLFNKKWNSDFSEIRNSMIDIVSSEWILQLDADEYLDQKDAKYLKDFIKIFSLLDINPKVISPKIVDHTNREYFITNRIFKKDFNFRYYGLVHEELRYNNKTIASYVSTNFKIYHDGYMKEIIENKDKYNRNVDLLKRMIKIEPKNVRWYYFLSRDSILLGLSRSYIESVILEGLSCTEIDSNNYKLGLLIKLIEINLNNNIDVTKFIDMSKRKSPNCIDTYYYELLVRYSNIIEELSITNAKSITNISKIKDDFSIVNNDYGHLFSLWGWIYFSVKNYELAFSMFKKIKCKDDIEIIVSELVSINSQINELIAFYKNKEYL